MFDLLDIVRQAQGGTALDNLARQFGLPSDQARRAVEALLPAFAIGLERNATLNPFAFAQLLQSGQNPMLAFLQGAQQGFAPSAQAQGNALLGPLFGPPQVAQGVVREAAAISGVAAPVIRQMLPILAGLVVAGVLHVALNQDYPALFARLGEAMRGQPAPPPRPPAPDLFGMMLNPMLALAPPPPPPPPPPPLGAVGRLFEAGREAQEQHLKTFQAIFDAFWAAPKATPAGKP